VLAAAAAGARVRRMREVSRQVWRAAPAAAAAAVLAAAFVRWRGAAALWLLALPVAAATGLMIYSLVMRRQPRISDALASEIDRDAGLGGELRSAAWFAGRRLDDAWTSFHLTHAAERIESVEFKSVYPAVRARRARAATWVMTAAAI
jgi:hypothetical protein